MTRIVKFQQGIAFESNTLYVGDQPEYHIHLEDAQVLHGLNGYGLPEGLAAGVSLRGLENVTIDLQGARLIFHGRIAPFFLDNCKNITLKNLSIDYDRPFYSQATILEAANGRLRLQPDSEFPCGYVDGVFSAIAPTWTKPLTRGHVLMLPFDTQTRAPAFQGWPILASFAKNDDDRNPPMPITWLEEQTLPDGTWEWKGEIPETWQAGQIVVFTHEKRDKNAIFAAYCQNTVVENVRLLACAAMGFVGFFCNDISLRRFDMYLDEKSRGLLSCNADSVHCFHCTGTILVEDCIFENMNDDAINVHGNYTRIDEILPDGSLKCSCPGAVGGGMHWYKNGDRLAVHLGATAEVRGEATVASVDYPENDGFLLRLETVGGFACSAGDVLENMAMPELIIRRCVTGKNRPRGFLISTAGKTLVEDCLFRNLCCAIHFTSDMTYWFESCPVRDVTIRRCHFQDCNYGGGAPIIASPQVPLTENVRFVHSGITIEDNIFENCSGRFLWAQDAKDVIFRRNRHIRSAFYKEIVPEDPAERVPVYLKNCHDCTIEL